jgi:hypothetical protein
LQVFRQTLSLSPTLNHTNRSKNSSAMSLKSVIVTGANRGIGLEFVRQLLAATPPPKHLIATSRQTSNPELDQLRAKNSALHVLTLEVKNYESFAEFAKQVEQIVGTDGVDTLINNAGILINKDLQSVTADDMIQNFEVNTVSPLILTKALLPLLKVRHRISHSLSFIPHPSLSPTLYLLREWPHISLSMNTSRYQWSNALCPCNRSRQPIVRQLWLTSPQRSGPLTTIPPEVSIRTGPAKRR